jgi:DNA replicative helicase MCM subunit Mcm2 (Cdc46/Mcm family)
LLREIDKIKAQLENKNKFKQAEISEKISIYEKCIQEIRAKCPYEIRLNMFLVETEDLNNRLVELCEECIDVYNKAIRDFVFSEEAI